MTRIPMIILSLLGGLWLMTAAVAQDADAVPPTVQQSAGDPKQLIQQITDSVLSRLRGHQEEMRRDPHRIYALVETLVLPHFDFERMSRWVLGQYWNEATPMQRTRFVEEFRNLLVRTYGVALLDYTDEKIQFLPSHGDLARGDVTVRTNIRHRSEMIEIDSALYLKDGEWKIYDVTIEGVSLVTNYRNSFANEIREGGMDGLINKIATRNQGKGGERG